MNDGMTPIRVNNGNRTTTKNSSYFLLIKILLFIKYYKAGNESVMKVVQTIL